MTHFWATLAIVSAIWATTGTVDGGSLLATLGTCYCLWELHTAEKNNRSTHHHHGEH